MKSLVLLLFGGVALGILAAVIFPFPLSLAMAVVFGVCWGAFVANI